MKLEVIQLDKLTKAIYFYTPRYNIVYLQGVIELYEGLATLRTIDIKQSLMCLITTNEQMGTALEMMEENREEINWRPAVRSDISDSDYLYAYGKKRLEKEKI